MRVSSGKSLRSPPFDGGTVSTIGKDRMKLPHRRQFLHLAAGAVALPAMSSIARAQTYPTRPVRAVVAFAPGGVTDTFARLMAQKLTEHLGKQVYVENIAGASGNIGTGQVAKAAPDGYTILFAFSSHVVNPDALRPRPVRPHQGLRPGHARRRLDHRAHRQSGGAGEDRQRAC
jgi:hypothetical protein